LTSEESEQLRKQVAERLSSAFDAAQQNAERYELQELSAVSTEEIASYGPRTSVDRQLIERIVEGITRFPSEFHLHPKLRGFVEKRREALAEGGPIDWAFG
jgi:2-oxoglutarate dehydrogenase complex dehydrogenase (E1) component-like enzyme